MRKAAPSSSRRASRRPPWRTPPAASSSWRRGRRRRACRWSPGLPRSRGCRRPPGTTARPRCRSGPARRRCRHRRRRARRRSTEAHDSSAPVLAAAMRTQRPTSIDSSLSRATSSACPAIISATASARTLPAAVAAAVGVVEQHLVGEVCRASPTRIAWPTPNSAHTVGRCRRSRSPSMMSSWSNEKLWTSSTATAPGTATSASAPTASAESTASAGRIRLPLPSCRRAVGRRRSRSGTPAARRRSGCSRLQRGDEHRVDELPRAGEHVGQRRPGDAGCPCVRFMPSTSSGWGTTAVWRAADDGLGRGDAAAHSAFHRRRPARIGPRSGEVEATDAGDRTGPETPRSPVGRRTSPPARGRRPSRAVGAAEAAGNNRASSSSAIADQRVRGSCDPLGRRRQRHGEALFPPLTGRPDPTWRCGRTRTAAGCRRRRGTRSSDDPAVVHEVDVDDRRGAELGPPSRPDHGVGEQRGGNVVRHRDDDRLRVDALGRRRHRDATVGHLDPLDGRARAHVRADSLERRRGVVGVQLRQRDARPADVAGGGVGRAARSGTRSRRASATPPTPAG